MIRYEIKTNDSASHEFKINFVFEAKSEGPLPIHLPLWRPGRYERADFAKNITNIKAWSSEDEPFKVKRMASHSWQVENAKGFCRISYDYLAQTMDAGNSVLDESQIYLNFISCLLYSPAYLDESVEIKIDIPNNYRTATALPEINHGIFSADNFHHLVDSPLLASKSIHSIKYVIDDTTFHIHTLGERPLTDEEVTSAFEKFSRKQMNDMQGFPTKRYHFIIQSLDYKHYHGVEHQHSTVLVLGPNTPEHKASYWDKLIGVASHELFHTWNVTRIRPSEMSPYAYHEEIQFVTGFVAEGFTTYYGDHFLATSGVFSESQYLNELTTHCNRHFQNFGRFHSSLIDSSQRLWIDGYRNTSPSKKVSVYVKGALVSLLLDLEIRKATDHRNKLLDVIKGLYQDHTFEKGGYDWSDVKGHLEKVGGPEVRKLAELLVETCEPIEDWLVKRLEWVGLELKTQPHEDPFTAFTGTKINAEQVVIDIAPACPSSAILSLDDKILTADGNELKETNWDQQTITFRVKRGVKIFEVPITREPDYSFHAYEVVAEISPNPKQVEFKTKWLS